jgi:hypothetical protein
VFFQNVSGRVKDRFYYRRIKKDERKGTDPRKPDGNVGFSSWSHCSKHRQTEENHYLLEGHSV